MIALVGNDVVDLGNPRVEGKERDARFLARILDPSERAVVEASDDPALDLWSMWAAKESAFKIASKLRSVPPAFSHPAFLVTWSDSPSRECVYGAATRAGQVRYEEDLTVRVAIVRLQRAVVAVALPAGAPAPAASIHTGGAVLSLDEHAPAWVRAPEVLLGSLTAREAEAVHSHASAAVRVGARRALAEALGVDETRLEIVCDPGPVGRRPPRVLLDGRAARADVSLSHDGPWIAWAYAIPGQGGPVRA